MTVICIVIFGVLSIRFVIKDGVSDTRRTMKRIRDLFDEGKLDA